ncbi:MAG TPA: glycosyltransferase family 39 protein [Thermoanaerobaculia bacterium]|nr:glycosyltransferase family 39 protein [Thermoanaerobaculia bacterium]
MWPHLPAIAVASVLLIFGILAFINAEATSPTSDELTHLAAGLSYIETGNFRLNREHPPLLKAIAALPLAGSRLFPDETTASDAAVRTRDAWDRARTDNGSQWRFAQLFFYGVTDAALQRTGGNNDDRSTLEPSFRTDYINPTESMFLRARMMMIALGIALGIVVFAWSKELWGAWGAFFSLLLFAFDPNFIAHSALVTTDVGVSLLMTLAVYFFWRAERGRWHAAAFLIVFGLAFLAKFSAVLLVPTLVAIAATSRVRKRAFLLIAAGGLTAVAAVWIAYGFRAGDAVDVESAVRDWAARRAALESFPSGIRQEDVDRLRATAPLGAIDRAILATDRLGLLPETYLFGFATTAGTAIGRPAFINGRFSLTGFYDYFAWTILYKLPLITLIAILAGIAVGWGTPARAYLLIPVAIYLGVAVWSRMNIGHRHILPIFPFLYVLAGSLGPWLARRRVVAAAAAVAIAVSANVVFFPTPVSAVGRHLSYVNEVGRGPLHGFRLVNDSNFDWGQDLERLGRWAAASRVREPINLVYFGHADPRYYGIRYHDLRPALFPVQVPGYLAISTIDYLGVLLSADQRHYWERFVERSGAALVGRAGHSILIFRIERLPASGIHSRH